VDESALIHALQSGRIAGAGLDVYEHEPDIPAELRGLPNTVLAAHVGSAVRELREQMANSCVDNILEALAGRRPPHCKNPEIYAAAA
jgi:glyoxylate reductase